MWITKDEAKKRLACVVAVVPNAKLEVTTHSLQVRSAGGKILVAYAHGSKRRGTDPKLWHKVI